MLDEAAERSDASGASDNSRVKPDRHHSRPSRRFRVKHFKRFPHVVVEIVRLNEARAVPKAEIIDIWRVWNDEMSLAHNLYKIRDVIVVGVRIIEEPALLDHEPPRPHAGTISAIPANRSLTAGFCKRLDRKADVFSLVLLRQLEHFLPPVTMAADLVPTRDSG